MSIPSNFCSCGSLKHRVDNEVVCLKCRKKSNRVNAIHELHERAKADLVGATDLHGTTWGERTEESLNPKERFQTGKELLEYNKRVEQLAGCLENTMISPIDPDDMFKGKKLTQEEYDHAFKIYARRQQEAAQQEAKATAVDMRRRYEDARAQQMSMPFGGLNQFQVLKSDYLARGSGKI